MLSGTDIDRVEDDHSAPSQSVGDLITDDPFREQSLIHSESAVEHIFTDVLQVAQAIEDSDTKSPQSPAEIKPESPTTKTLLEEQPMRTQMYEPGQ